MVEESTTETEEEREEKDRREVWLDQMVDQPDLDQYSPQVSIYSTSSSDSEEEMPELSAGPQREVQLIYGQDEEEEEPKLGCEPANQLDFVPDQEAEV